ncbi:uncharacterized protein LOC100215195 [Hydra vulgaris]|uniref:uncharacterized protein LOC100215195 n=1 Tax=Hydra vulgaris TaxID=6087 RepID=UPI001F5F72BF|nr:uncharacterized protein LOC100215195 [Hydra vulgaris]
MNRQNTMFQSHYDQYPMYQSQRYLDQQQGSQQQQYPIENDNSELKEFGDMGAAVKKFAEASYSKTNNYDSVDVAENIPEINDFNPYRKSHGLVAWDNFGGQIPDPYQRFEDFRGLNPAQLKALYNSGYKAPTPIQAQTWPIAMFDRDVVSIAKTGSGKTLAFLLPAYMKINLRRSQGTISVLVLAPTRELATQIQLEAEKFGSVAGYYSACAYGGAPKRNQLQAINSGISVLVATPGRLNDFLESNEVNLSSVFYLVLDEADRMLDMGFEPQIRTIIRCLPRKRQTLMFSATWPEEVRRLADDFLYQPVHIRLGIVGGSTSSGLQANEMIKQHLILLNSGEDKDGELINLIKSRFHQNRDLVLIFVARKNTCDFLTNILNRVGIAASAMHGDRDQKYREKTLAAFRDGSRPIMVATDLASRGIDVRGISAVINYDLANSTEDYVHRIGRTGRAGMSGESFTFLTRSNDDIWKAIGIVEVMAKTGQYPPPAVQELINRVKMRQEQNKERRAAENEQFSKVLIVAEKPSVAKMIAEQLSGGHFRTRRGKSRANQIFEFIKWFGPAQQKCKLMVTSVVGHIFGLGFAGRPDRDISKLFDASVEKQLADSTKKLNIVEHLQELGQESEYLFLWLDCDREGENIGFEVISLTQQWIPYDNVYRARFSALTKTELSQAYDNPVRPDKYAAMSVDARQELDLKIGVAFSRLMTRAFLDMAKEKFRLKDQKVVSYGPCQTPTLWFCVQRHKEIQNFKSTPFYVVSVVVNIQGQNITLKWVNDTVKNAEDLRQMESIIQRNPVAHIVDVKEDKKVVYKPIGLNTVTLLKSCSKGFGISPTQAMNIAEHLYTSGYISYPRTETTRYPPTFDLVGTLEEQVNNPNWGRIAAYILESGRMNPSQKGFDVGDHPPITPMRSANRDEFKPNEWRIYDYVTRHFIGTLHDNMEYIEKKMLVDVNGFQFEYVWHEITDKGFMWAMPWKLKGLKLNESYMPPINMLQGLTTGVLNFLKDEKYTQPPDYLQESELISLMDKHGIGTDASIPTHIKNVQDRHYVDVCGPSEGGQRGQLIQENKFFGKNSRGKGQKQQPKALSRHMVPRGFGLAFLSCFEDLDKELCEPSIRAYMEQQVSKIATGETDKNEVVSSNLKLFQQKFIYYRENLERVSKYFAPKVQGGHSGRDFSGDNSNQNYRAGDYRQNNIQKKDFGSRGRGRGDLHRGGRGGSSRGGRGGNFNSNEQYKAQNFENRYQNDGYGSYNQNENNFKVENQTGGNFQVNSFVNQGGFQNSGQRGSFRGGYNNNRGMDMRSYNNVGIKRSNPSEIPADDVKRFHHSY